MKIGFTGTRHGMTIAQENAVRDWLSHSDLTSFHHGDCLGADHQAAQYVLTRFGHQVIVCHPPLADKLRAHFAYGDILKALPYFDRNRAIVDATEHLLAAPLLMKEEDRGGTWYTINYARRLNRPITIVWPNGDVSGEIATPEVKRVE